MTEKSEKDPNTDVDPRSAGSKKLKSSELVEEFKRNLQMVKRSLKERKRKNSGQ